VKSKDHLCQDMRGAAALEFAIVLPLILLLLFGLIEFGLILYNKQVVTNASREGVRYAIVQPSSCSTTPSDCHNANAVNNLVDQYCSTNLVTFGTKNPPTTVITDKDSGSVLNTAANLCSAATGNKDIAVQVTYVYNFLVFDSIAKLFYNSTQDKTFSLSGTTIMRCEDIS
jgi:Flp pilus assembly protein TadG